MKTNKEYPATHSMSTAWYAIDEEGNVAIIDFDENGPVPFDAPGAYEYGIENLAYEELKKDNQSTSNIELNFTDEQALDLISGAKEAGVDTHKDFFDYIILIDTTKEKRFLEWVDTARRSADEYDVELHVISKKIGLYRFHLDGYKHIVEALIDEKILLKIKNVEIECDDKFFNKEYNISMEEANLPFYVYKQPYSTWNLIERLSEPKHPVKVDQLPQSVSNAFHLPFKFSEAKQFQIAEYLPCKFYNDGIIIDGIKGYSVLPLTNGEAAFFREDKDSINYILIDDAFVHHQVILEGYGNEYSINGKRGYFIDSKTNEFFRIGCSDSTPVSDNDYIEIVKNDTEE